MSEALVLTLLPHYVLYRPLVAITVLHLDKQKNSVLGDKNKIHVRKTFFKLPTQY